MILIFEICNFDICFRDEVVVSAFGGLFLPTSGERYKARNNNYAALSP
jgi:hypothetical protein